MHRHSLGKVGDDGGGLGTGGGLGGGGVGGGLGDGDGGGGGHGGVPAQLGTSLSKAVTTTTAVLFVPSKIEQKLTQYMEPTLTTSPSATVDLM